MSGENPVVVLLLCSPLEARYYNYSCGGPRPRGVFLLGGGPPPTERRYDVLLYLVNPLNYIGDWLGARRSPTRFVVATRSPLFNRLK